MVHPSRNYVIRVKGDLKPYFFVVAREDSMFHSVYGQHMTSHAPV